MTYSGVEEDEMVEEEVEEEEEEEEEEAEPEGLIEVEVGVDEEGRLQIEVHNEEGAAVLEGDAEARAVLEQAIQAVQADMDAAAPGAHGQEPAAAAAAATAAAPQEQADADAGAPDRTFHRYYHLYRKGELEEDVAAAGGVVLDSGYERDNWWAIAARSPS